VRRKWISSSQLLSQLMATIWHPAWCSYKSGWTLTQSLVVAHLSWSLCNWCGGAGVYFKHAAAAKGISNFGREGTLYACYACSNWLHHHLFFDTSFVLVWPCSACTWHSCGTHMALMWHSCGNWNWWRMLAITQSRLWSCECHVWTH